MYKKMLVPLDGSKLAESVLAFAARLAGRLGLEVTLLHVCDEPSSEFMCKAYIDHVAATTAKGFTVRGEVATGEAARTILDFARKNRVDLILMATHGRSGISGWTTGSVAHKVLAGAQSPVLLMRPGKPAIKPDKWPENILVPLDGSPLAEAVLPHIEALAKQGGLEMSALLLRVCEPPVLLADYPEAIQRLTWEEHVKKATAAAEKTCRVYLGDVEKRLGAVGVKVHSTEAALGDNVADRIAEYLNKHPCDLIAMTTHGKSGASEWPYGRVVDRLIKTTDVPLFLVRPAK